MRPMLYLIGPSGSGKTTAMKFALDGLDAVAKAQPIMHQTYTSGVVQLGMDRETFGGTDALPLDANPKAIRFLQETAAPAVIGEGDRLANDKFFRAALEAGYALTIAYLDTPEPIARQRRLERGSTYRESWAKGRHTKARNLAERWGRMVWRIDGRKTPEEIAARLREHSAIQMARG